MQRRSRTIEAFFVIGRACRCCRVRWQLY